MRDRVLIVEQNFRSIKVIENTENLKARVMERKDLLNRKVDEVYMKVRNFN